jgi:hypothetical protein
MKQADILIVNARVLKPVVTICDGRITYEA